MASSSPNQLDTLVDLITAAVKVVKHEYAAAGREVPTLDSTLSGPFDQPESMSSDLARAIQTIEAACAQLNFSVASPRHVMLNKAFEFEEPTCLQVVLEARIADLLLDKPEGVHIDELGSHTGLDAGRLGRLPRVLATKHCFREGIVAKISVLCSGLILQVQPNVYANNRLNPLSSMIGHMYMVSQLSPFTLPILNRTDETLRSSAYLNDCFHDPKPESYPFHRAHGCSHFEYFYSPQGHKAGDVGAPSVGCSLAHENHRSASHRQWLVLESLWSVYPWRGLPQDATICDIGGGNGHVMLDIIKQFPQVKAVVQNLPTAIEQGKEFWTKEHPEAIQKGRIKFVPFDFKDPPVAGCDMYYIRFVLHAWQREDCIKILSNIKKAMKPSSRLLVHEFVLQQLVRNQDTLIEEAPEPLLPNYGMGKLRLYQQDINMSQCPGKDSAGIH